MVEGVWMSIVDAVAESRRLATQTNYPDQSDSRIVIELMVTSVSGRSLRSVATFCISSTTSQAFHHLAEQGVLWWESAAMKPADDEELALVLGPAMASSAMVIVPITAV